MRYDRKYIDQLLELYWEGETSLSQEAELRSYFAEDSIAEEHTTYAPLFAHFAAQRQMTTDLEVEQVLRSIEKTVAPKPRFSLLSIVGRAPYRMGIAAAMTAMLAVTVIINYPAQSTNMQTVVLSESKDTEEALRVTKTALAFLTKKMDKSSKSVKTGMVNLKRASILK